MEKASSVGGASFSIWSDDKMPTNYCSVFCLFIVLNNNKMCKPNKPDKTFWISPLDGRLCICVYKMNFDYLFFFGFCSYSEENIFVPVCCSYHKSIFIQQKECSSKQKNRCWAKTYGGLCMLVTQSSEPDRTQPKHLLPHDTHKEPTKGRGH